MTTPVDPLIGYFNQAHQNSDVNEDVDSLHHTLGPGPQQAAPGNHTHGDGIVGSLIMFAGLSTPTKYILCDGSAIDRVTFAALFATIGTLYGAGNGVTTFNLPNFTNAFPRGNAIGSGGSDTHQHSAVDVGTPSGSLDFQSAGTPSGTLSIDSNSHNHAALFNTNSVNDGHNHGAATATTSLGQQSNTTATGASLRLTSPDPHSHGINATGTSHSHLINDVTGGENATHNHTLTGNALPTHAHNFFGNDMGFHQHDLRNNVPVFTGVKFFIRYAA